MTHDLLANIIDGLGAKIEKIVINDLRDHTFYAQIHLTLNGKITAIDSRPSDAIALGAALSVPILVADHVLDEVSR